VKETVKELPDDHIAGVVRDNVASFPGPKEEGECAWFPLFVHVGNYP